MPCDCKVVGCQGGLNLWVIEVDHCPLVCEHVHLKWNTQKEMKRWQRTRKLLIFKKTFVLFFLSSKIQHHVYRLMIIMLINLAFYIMQYILHYPHVDNVDPRAWLLWRWAVCLLLSVHFRQNLLYLFNARDVVDSQFLEGELQLLVICCSCSVHHLLLSAGWPLQRTRMSYNKWSYNLWPGLIDNNFL